MFLMHDSSPWNHTLVGRFLHRRPHNQENWESPTTTKMKAKKMVKMLSGGNSTMPNRRRDKEGRGEGSRRSSSSSSTEEEYKVDEPPSSRGGRRFKWLEDGLEMDANRFNFALNRDIVINGFKDSVIHPESRWYRMWVNMILVWAVYSSFFTPLEFGFFRGLPHKFFVLDIVGQTAFLVDIVLQFFVSYRDTVTYQMVTSRRLIALRYLKSSFVMDLLACMPWDLLYKFSGRKEEVRVLLWIRMIRVRKLVAFFQELEKDIRINYLFSRIIKFLFVELYSGHIAACIFYYLATTLPEEQEGYTWIGSLKIGEYSYSHFREIDLGRRYTTSLYFSIVTMTTVGYGEIHAVNLREMIFVMIYISIDMVLGAYLVGNITALIVKGSKTERFRDRMADVMKFMNRNRLGRDLRDQIKGHLRLQYESGYNEAAVLQDIPVSIRAKISEFLHTSCMKKAPLLKGCSEEFINQIVIRLHEEFFLPGEVILEQGNVVDQLYFVCDGVLEKVGISEQGLEETFTLLEPYTSFGGISILCNVPQPYTVRVCQLCRLLRIEKQLFTNIIEIYFHDGRKVFNNLLEEREYHVKQIELDITYHLGKQESELALKVNNAAYTGDLFLLKELIRAGGDPNKTDYDGRAPLHLAASRGYEDIALFLIQESVDVNASDCFGNSPLLEATRNGHDRVAEVLFNAGATLSIKDAGNYVCSAVGKGDYDLIKRLLLNGIEPDCRDYDQRTPLHVATSHGLFIIAKLLVDAGASVFTKDRWGNTPLDEARMGGNKNLIKLLEDAKSAQLIATSQENKDKIIKPRKCTVFPSDPSEYNEHKTHGVVLWIPNTINELIQVAAEKLKVPCASGLMTEDRGEIHDTDMIEDGQRLYLITETQ